MSAVDRLDLNRPWLGLDDAIGTGLAAAALARRRGQPGGPAFPPCVILCDNVHTVPRTADLN